VNRAAVNGLTINQEYGEAHWPSTPL